MGTNRITKVSCALAAALSLPAVGQLRPAGPEFAVNAFFPGDQDEVAVCLDDAGNAVFAWESDGQDGSDNGVFARRFSSSGPPLDPADLTVHESTVGEQEDPAVCCHPDGVFVVVWEALQAEASEGEDVFARIYEADGTPRTGELRLNLFTAGDQSDPRVDCTPAGGFVAVWDSDDQDGSVQGVYGRRFGADGGAIGDVIELNAVTVEAQFDPDVSVRPDGSFVATWADSSPAEGTRIVWRRFSAAGTALDTEEQTAHALQVGSYDDGQVDGRVDGGFVIAWNGPLGGDEDIRIRSFAADGSPLADEVVVNTTTAGDQFLPGLDVSPHGDATVVWMSDHEGLDLDAYQRSLSPDLTPLDPEEVQVNTFDPPPPSFQAAPEIALNGDGGVIVWESVGQDGDGAGIFAQRYVGPVDLALTSSATPDPVEATGTITYEVVVTNDGPSRAREVVVIDELPDGTSFVGSRQIEGDGGGPCALEGDTVTCRLGALDVGLSTTIEIDLAAPAEGGPLTNTVSVVATNADLDASDDVASVDVVVTPVADLELTKLDDPDPVSVGAELTYTLQVTNLGPSTATDVTIVDQLPDGVSLPDGRAGGAEVTVVIPTLAPGETASTPLIVLPEVSGTWTNVATVSANELDPDPTNDAASADTLVLAAPSVALDASCRASCPGTTILARITGEAPGTAGATVQIDLVDPRFVPLLTEAVGPGAFELVREIRFPPNRPPAAQCPLPLTYQATVTTPSGSATATVEVETLVVD